jgi:ribosomal protein S18 acetylase RimI-like enzyme
MAAGVAAPPGTAMPPGVGPVVSERASAPHAATETGLHPLDNPAWEALRGPHSHVADVVGRARRYRRGVSVFSGTADASPESWEDLARLAGPGRSLLLTRAEIGPVPAGWDVIGVADGHQMTVERPADASDVALQPLGAEHATEMKALVELTKPGPFELGTVGLGSYVGVFEDGRLIAMAGERFRFAGHTEISAVCTHPSARRRGLGAALTRHVALGILARGEVPFLHVATTNDNARRVYERLGFTTRRMTQFAILRAPRDASTPAGPAAS